MSHTILKIVRRNSWALAYIAVVVTAMLLLTVAPMVVRGGAS